MCWQIVMPLTEAGVPAASGAAWRVLQSRNPGWPGTSVSGAFVDSYVLSGWPLFSDTLPGLVTRFGQVLGAVFVGPRHREFFSECGKGSSGKRLVLRRVRL
jgi:hypothetical protein